MRSGWHIQCLLRWAQAWTRVWVRALGPGLSLGSALSLAFFLAWVAFSGAAQAQTQPIFPAPDVSTSGGAIGGGGGANGLLTVDTEQLYSGSRYGQEIEATLNRERSALQEENRRLEEALEAEEARLAEIRPDTAPEEFSALAREFDTRVQSIRHAQDTKLRALVQKRETAQQAFLNQVLSVVAEVARERGAVAVMDRRNLFMSDQSIDITQAAISRIDARFLRVRPDQNPQGQADQNAPDAAQTPPAPQTPPQAPSANPANDTTSE